MYGPLLQQDRPDRLWWVLADAHRRNLRCEVGSISFERPDVSIADTKDGDRFVEFRLQGQSNDNWTRQ
jgi:hypothetical protein